MTPPVEPSFGPLQLLVVGFASTEQFRGDIAREVNQLRGRGLIRVIDARLLSRSADGELTQLDLNPVLGEPAAERGRPAAHLFGLNGGGNGGGNGGFASPEAYMRTAGFAIEDLRRLTDEIGPGEIAGVVLVEHVWAADLQKAIREAGGLLVAQGMLTPEVMMIVGAELQATADAQAALELAEAARGAALLDALSTLSTKAAVVEQRQSRSSAAAEVVQTLVGAGFIHDVEAAEAIDALVAAGIVETALLEGAAAEAEDLLAKLEDEPPPEA